MIKLYKNQRIKLEHLCYDVYKNDRKEYLFILDILNFGIDNREFYKPRVICLTKVDEIISNKSSE